LVESMQTGLSPSEALRLASEQEAASAK
jgi:hypothetical protein